MSVIISQSSRLGRIGLSGAEEIDDGADGGEGVALERGDADVECGFELVAELDQVECVGTEVTNKVRVKRHLAR